MVTLIYFLVRIILNLRSMMPCLCQFLNFEFALRVIFTYYRSNVLGSHIKCGSHGGSYMWSPPSMWELGALLQDYLSFSSTSLRSVCRLIRRGHFVFRKKKNKLGIDFFILWGINCCNIYLLLLRLPSRSVSLLTET